jgi:hypothetical protein
MEGPNLGKLCRFLCLSADDFTSAHLPQNPNSSYMDIVVVIPCQQHQGVIGREARHGPRIPI